MANAADSVSLARILNVPKRGIGKTSAARFFELSEQTGSLVGALGDRSALLAGCGKAAAARLSSFGELLSTLRRLAESADAASVLRQVLQATKYENYLREDDPSTADDRLENVYELLNAAEEFSAESDEPGLGPFLESVALLAEVDKMTDETDLVTLMTVHNAKGLEFPYVFIAGCEEGLMPHASSIEDDDQLEEERRLFYVALTRAEEAVILTAAAPRRKFGSTESTLASRFVGEIPAEMVVEMGNLAFGERSWSPTTSRGHSRGPRNLGLPASDRGPRSKRNRDAGVSVDALADAQSFLRSRAKSKSKPDRGSDHGFDDHDLSQEEISYQVGMRVEHELLGEGVIEELEGVGDLLRLTVRFGDQGRKRILARYARLRALDSEAGAQ